MKTICCTGIFVLTSTASIFAAPPTAYEALRVVGKDKGDTLLETVCEVRGRLGAPQPTLWKIVAKSGREFDVRAGKLTAERDGSERTKPLNLSMLQLDSDGAHTLAEREAKKAGFSYDHVDYVLRTGTKGTPTWEVKLVDLEADETVVLNIGADNGKIISNTGFKRVVVADRARRDEVPDRVADGPVTDRRESREGAEMEEELPPPQRQRPVVAEEEEEEPRYAGRTVYHQGYEKVRDKLRFKAQQRGGQLSDWFRRTFSRGGGSGSTPAREREDQNETRYYRPSPGERPKD